MITALDWAWLGRKRLLAESFCWLAATPPIMGLRGERLRGCTRFRSLKFRTCSPLSATGEGYLQSVAHIMRDMPKEIINDGTR
jgi:hypothetical protein